MTAPLKTKYTIAVLPGDGIGPEVVDEAVKVLRLISSLAQSKGKYEISLEVCPFGGCAIDEVGTPLPDETLRVCREADAILLGAVGGPKWGPEAPIRPEPGLLKLRKELGLFANIRPALFPSQSLVPLSPIKESLVSGTNIVVLRELIGGIYFGDRVEYQGSFGTSEEEEKGTARDECSYSVGEVRRIARLAGWLATQQDPPLAVHSVDKANVLATSRLWRKTVTQVFKEEFPNLTLNHQLVDSASMLIVASPRKLNGVILTENLFGDILSDETSVIPGSLGLLPSASLSRIPSPTSLSPGLYEPIHGSAPDIAGSGVANPIGTILSVGMLLKYSLGLEEEAKAVEEAVRKVLDEKSLGGKELRTKDLGGGAGTKEVGDAVCEILKGLLDA
ncbi:3-isopropylmalate dehydrogenase [Atractiella rhizophila]|nr:3-isopropylmalate dehydrogenase [Atractiella rhizophila]